MNDGMMIRGVQYGGIGTFTPRTASQTGAQRVAFGDAPYFDLAHRGQIYWAANQAATAWSVALATTYTGIVVSNPTRSMVDLVILRAGFALSVAPAAIAHMGFFGGFATAGITVHTTPLDVYNAKIFGSSGSGNAGKADAAATLVGTPLWMLPFMGGFTAGALPSTTPAMLDLAGMFIVPPGGYFGIGALTAVTGFGGLVWAEIPNETV